MWQANAFQNSGFQTALVVIIATVLLFKTLQTIARLQPVLITTVVSEFLGPQPLYYESGLAVYYEDGGAAYGKVL
jgi:hypothetical protein